MTNTRHDKLAYKYIYLTSQARKITAVLDNYEKLFEVYKQRQSELEAKNKELLEKNLKLQQEIHEQTKHNIVKHKYFCNDCRTEVQPSED